MTTVRLRAVALAAVLALPLAAAAGEPFKVIANASVPRATLTREELARAFLRKTTRWPDGSEIRPAEPRGDAAARAAFGERVLGMSRGALRSYWTQMIFSGRDVPPVEKASDEQVVAYVREHPGALGYVSADADTSGVKVLPLRP